MNKLNFGWIARALLVSLVPVVITVTNLVTDPTDKVLAIVSLLVILGLVEVVFKRMGIESEDVKPFGMTHLTYITLSELVWLSLATQMFSPVYNGNTLALLLGYFATFVAITGGAVLVMVYYAAYKQR